MSEIDPLLEILKVVRLRSALFFNAEMSAPWCLHEPGSDVIGRSLNVSSGHLILFHLVLQGTAFSRTADGSEEILNADDIVVIPHGDVHTLGNGWPEKPVDAVTTFAGNLKDGLKLVKFGGGGEVTKLVCGYMVVDRALSEVFLAGLPRMMKVRGTDGPSGEWLKNSIVFSVGQDGSAASNLVISKLSEVLFIETLRRYISALPDEVTGWLAGARDPFVGKILALIHSQPEKDWSVPELARSVGLSRTRLAERFNHFMDDSPMSYLTKWRLKLGADLLESTGRSISDISAAVGYGSEATFNRAFKRGYALPPAQYRRMRRG
jgi:AraC-like DNA-binding protein